ncbi:MAG TPA: indole-3-glycerol phosphate synthase TrpC [Verrucomicrobiales bacterium]|nr:indole-3-glycerol phosphate synthase TrpC [Verrucomicrobiales bacterium]|tara:strand:+ start:4679 stop:5479 length:801 start_codon:yes stop_codon:yes gene_type:complete
MSILDEIVQTKFKEVSHLEYDMPSESYLKSKLSQRGVRPFLDSLRSPRRGDVALIAEIKKASPSKGVICPDFDPVRIAQAYQDAGATCLSVLTDVDYFQGSLEYLKAVRQAVDLPLLRKDFIIDARQIEEAIDYGADAILLIAAILDDQQLKSLHTLATGAGLTALVEVHDEEELNRVMSAGCLLVGVNNRNLKDFSVDLETTDRMAKLWRESGRPSGSVLVAESGIYSRKDVLEVKKGGASAVLVGESLMRDASNIQSKVVELLG